MTKAEILKKFKVDPDRVYNEMAAITLSIWYFRDKVCELEPIGPMELLAPGACAAFTEEWWLVPYAFPALRAAVDLQDVVQVVRRATGETI